MMSRKSQSQKKRHTKPCKFFQMNRCPHPAEVCDFAHVIATPFGGIPADKNLPICRYYQAGHCANGLVCKYRHELEVSPSAGIFDVQAVTDSVADWAFISPSEATYPDSPPIYGSSPSYIHSWPSAAYCSINSPISPQSPEFMPLVPSARSRDSMQSLDTSTSNSSLESNDIMIVTEDPQYNEHSHSHQSQVCVADDSPLIHVQPFRPPFLYINAGAQTPTNTYPEFMYGARTGGKSPPYVKSRSSVSKSSLKQKALKFKTKPCKFFPTEKGCPNGNACTFLHDEMAHERASPTPSKASTSAKEDSDRKNFVPIPWRVIGGGVLVSTAKKGEGEGKNEGSDEEREGEAELEEAAEENRGKDENGAKDMDKDGNRNFSDNQVDCPLPSRPTIDIQAIKIGSRQRSNSIPSTPSITHVKVEHLFSAESPGVL